MGKSKVEGLIYEKKLWMNAKNNTESRRIAETNQKGSIRRAWEPKIIDK